MTVMVCRDAAGAVWIANGQGDILAAGFFKTEDERRHMVYPPVHLAAGTARDPAAWGEGFLEVGRPRAPAPTRVPRREDTPCAGPRVRQLAGGVTWAAHGVQPHAGPARS